jgi:hypothetical protein
LKKGGGSREKGEEETKFMPHVPVRQTAIFGFRLWSVFPKRHGLKKCFSTADVDGEICDV